MTFSLSTSNLNDLLGVVFICNLFIATLFGITCVQVYQYHLNHKDDGRVLRWTVFLLWIFDCANFGLYTHRIYYQLILHYGDLSPLLPPHNGLVSGWSLISWCVVAALSDFIVRVVFVVRVWHFSKRNVPLAIVLVFFNLLVLVFGVAFPLKTINDLHHRPDHLYSWMLLAFLASVVVADGTIAGSMCVLLWKSRTGIKRTDSTLKILILYSINTGLVTSLFALLSFFTYLAMPTRLIYIFFFSSLPKLYFNALLANLNARKSVGDRMKHSSTPIVTRDLSFRKGKTGSFHSTTPMFIGIKTATESNRTSRDVGWCTEV